MSILKIRWKKINNFTRFDNCCVDVTSAGLAATLAVNAFGPLLVAKYLAPLLQKGKHFYQLSVTFDLTYFFLKDKNINVWYSCTIWKIQQMKSKHICRWWVDRVPTVSGGRQKATFGNIRYFQNLNIYFEDVYLSLVTFKLSYKK